MKEINRQSEKVFLDPHDQAYIKHINKLTGFDQSMLDINELQTTQWPDIPVKAFFHTILANMGFSDGILIPINELSLIEKTIDGLFKNTPKGHTGIWVSTASKNIDYRAPHSKITSPKNDTKKIALQMCEKLSNSDPLALAKLYPQFPVTMLRTLMEPIMDGEIQSGATLSAEFKTNKKETSDARGGDGNEKLLRINALPHPSAFSPDLETTKFVAKVLTDNHELLSKIVPLTQFFPCIFELMVMPESTKVEFLADITPMISRRYLDMGKITTARQLQKIAIDLVSRWGTNRHMSMQTLLDNIPATPFYPLDFAGIVASKAQQASQGLASVIYSQPSTSEPSVTAREKRISKYSEYRNAAQIALASNPNWPTKPDGSPNTLAEVLAGTVQ